MKRIFSLLLLLVYCHYLIGMTFNEKTKQFEANSLSFSLDPVIEYLNTTHEQSIKTNMSLSQISKNVNDQILLTFKENDLILNMTVSPKEGCHVVNVSLSGSNQIKILNLFITLNFGNNSQFLKVYKGPEAIMKQDSAKNLPLSPYTNRFVQFRNSNNHFVNIIASHFSDTYGIENIDGNNLYLFNSAFHAERLVKFMPQRVFYNFNFYPLEPNEEIKAQFIMTDSEMSLPLINLFPWGKRAALSFQNDADGEHPSISRTIFYGVNSQTDPDYGHKGLIANNIKITNSVFGINYSAMRNLWQEIIDSGNTIAYHTFENKSDRMDSLAQNLPFLTRKYNIRLWIDHSSAENCEDFARLGFVPDSSYYAYPIVRNAGLKYIWMDDYKTMSLSSFNAFKDISMLPHRSYALAKDSDIYITTRFRTVSWIHQDYPYAFKYLIVPENLDHLIEERGYANIYTHFFYRNEGNTKGYMMKESDNIFRIRPDVEECLNMLNNYQQTKGLWIAPSEEIFDRFLAIDSLKIINTTQTRRQIGVTLHNQGYKKLSDISIEFFDQKVKIPVLNSHEMTTVFFQNGQEYLDDRTIAPLNLSQLNPYIVSSKSKITLKFNQTISSYVKKVQLYNIKGQEIHQSIQAIDDKIFIDSVKLPSGVYLCKIETVDSQVKVCKISFVK